MVLAGTPAASEACARTSGRLFSWFGFAHRGADQWPFWTGPACLPNWQFETSKCQLESCVICVHVYDTRKQLPEDTKSIFSVSEEQQFQAVRLTLAPIISRYPFIESADVACPPRNQRNPWGAGSPGAWASGASLAEASSSTGGFTWSAKGVERAQKPRAWTKSALRGDEDC